MVEYVDLEESKGPSPREVEYRNFKRLQNHNYVVFSLHLLVVLFGYFMTDDTKFKMIIMLMYGISGFLMSMVLNIRLSLLRRKYNKVEEILEDIASKNRKKYK